MGMDRRTHTRTRDCVSSDPAIFVDTVTSRIRFVQPAPQALSGHSSSGGSHDIATNSLVLHILAASIWMGGIAALVLHARRKGSYLDFAARRFSAVALMAFVVIAISGVVNAAVRVPLTAVWSSTYGVLILAKVAALVLTGLAGWRQRTIAIAELTKDPSDGRTFIRLAGVESVVLAVTVGIAVAWAARRPRRPRNDRIRAESRRYSGMRSMAYRLRAACSSTGDSISFSELSPWCWLRATSSAFFASDSRACSGRRSDRSAGLWGAWCCLSQHRREWVDMHPQ